jgi:D-tagatose-1,6-bisphosphate aldolase subunit GatZ/KbaZ
MNNPFDEIVQSQKRGEVRGITSICSAHPSVLKAALKGNDVVLIESTCNQVNQFGGYTGMLPADFVCFVKNIAAQNGFPEGRLFLGGDHLGPSPWQEQPAAAAMSKATELVHIYVQSGYSKIHLDASMRLADDPPGPLDPEISAQRTAQLARAAENAISDATLAPHYVIGTEVPVPGGAREHEDGIRVTTVEDARHTLDITHAAFVGAGLESAWERVIALVVQPGVEFGDDFVLDYNPVAASGLARFSETAQFVYEAHSTDYQKSENLRALVRDHFAILKVGPALTFAYREAVFALALMENELIPAERCSNLVKVLEDVMVLHPEYWRKYYHGDEIAQRLARKFSLSDRLRYYWGDPQVQKALDRLMQNLLEKELPRTLLSQYAPVQCKRVRNKRIDNKPEAIILDKINCVLEEYAFAVGSR